VDPRAGLDDAKKRNFLKSRDSNSDPSDVQPEVSRSIDYAIPATSMKIDYMWFFVKKKLAI
jgi:hypothetical protein